MKKRPVFYCSDSAIASILESKPKIGVTICLSIWKPVIKRDVQFALFMPEDIDPSNKWWRQAKELHKELKRQTPYFHKDKEGQLNELNRFVCTQYISEKPPYSITSWLSDWLIYNQDLKNDLILYPCLFTHSQFNNFAIHPNFVDKYLALEKVVQILMEDLREPISYSIGLLGTPDRMNIRWQKPTDAQVRDLKKIINEGTKI